MSDTVDLPFVHTDHNDYQNVDETDVTRATTQRLLRRIVQQKVAEQQRDATDSPVDGAMPLTVEAMLRDLSQRLRDVIEDPSEIAVHYVRMVLTDYFGVPPAMVTPRRVLQCAADLASEEGENEAYDAGAAALAAAMRGPKDPADLLWIADGLTDRMPNEPEYVRGVREVLAESIWMGGEGKDILTALLLAI